MKKKVLQFLKFHQLPQLTKTSQTSQVDWHSYGIDNKEEDAHIVNEQEFIQQFDNLVNNQVNHHKWKTTKFSLDSYGIGRDANVYSMQPSHLQVTRGATLLLTQVSSSNHHTTATKNPQFSSLHQMVYHVSQTFRSATKMLARKNSQRKKNEKRVLKFLKFP